MTNGERFNTAKERAEAFVKHAEVSGITLHGGDERDMTRQLYESAFAWLDFEAVAEEPLPCPFCGSTNNIILATNSAGGWLVRCCTCGYRSMVCETEDAAIAAHNRVARAAKEKEEHND